MRKYVKSFIFIMILFVTLFVNINGVKADGGYCSVGKEVSEAYACDYSSDNVASNVKYTMFFIKNSNGGYCAEIADLSLTIKGGFFSNFANAVTFGWTFKDASNQNFTEQEKRQVAGIELGASTIKSVFDSKSCPRLKMNIFTYDFGDTGAKKLSIATEDSDDWYMCQITAGTGTYFNEFCVLSDGTNGRSISKEEAQQTVEDANEDRNNIIEAIFNWGKKDSDTHYDGVSGNPCALINGEVRDLLHQVFLGISIGGIIILIVMTAISLIKVITASEDNALSNFIKGLWKRIICLIILLLLPTIITFLIQVVNGVGVAWNINSGNPLCDITE